MSVWEIEAEGSATTPWLCCKKDFTSRPCKPSEKLRETDAQQQV